MPPALKKHHSVFHVSFLKKATPISPSLGSVPERPLFPGLYFMIVNNYKTIIVSHDSLNPTHPITVAKAKPQ